MRLADLFLGQLEREAAGTRRTLERVPEGRNDWKPHERSMPLGYLASLVATMPSWIAMMITVNEFDMARIGTTCFIPKPRSTSRELVQLLDQSVAAACQALSGASDVHLMSSWRMLMDGRVVSEQVRHIAISDGVLNHLAHHRGQLTVYLRLIGVAVPALYGPSADEGYM